MEASVFIQIVQEHGAFDSEQQARETVETVLEAFSESISRGTAEDVAEQLPEEYADHMLVDETEDAEPVEYTDFLNRISETTDVDREAAVFRAAAVLAGLARALDEFEFSNIEEQLPAEYEAVFNTDAATTEVDLSEVVAAETDLDEDAAESATAATLDVLADRLTWGEAEDLAVYVGEAEGERLLAGESREAADFASDEFVSRVADNEDVAEAEAHTHVNAVMVGLESLAPSEMERAREQLGPAYEDLSPHP